MLTEEAKTMVRSYSPSFKGVTSNREFNREWGKVSNQIIQELDSLGITPLPKILRECKKELKPELPTPVEIAKKNSSLKISKFQQWSEGSRLSLEQRMSQYEKKTGTVFSVNEIQSLLSNVEHIAGIEKNQWVYSEESDSYVVEGSILDQTPETGLQRSDGKLWNITKQTVDGENIYRAVVVPERNTIIASKGDMMETDFKEGWKFAAKGNDVPSFTVSQSFLKGYLAFAEDEYEDEFQTQFSEPDVPEVEDDAILAPVSDPKETI